MASATPGGQYHAVQFYGTDDRLFSTVSAFLAEGLIIGEPAVIIASAAHREGMLEHLNARHIHVEQARRSGDLLVLDADEMLALFMVDGVPVPELFDTNIGRFIDQVLQGRPGSILRAYGGMVDILWKQGQRDAAIRLEILWNSLASRIGLALLCGYAMGGFFKQVPQLQEICTHHTHVFGPEHASPFSKLVTH
jgi:MEDS: MEthanogen/methylotroph, DcmR Sensory domain